MPKVSWEILAAATLIAISILFIGRYQISAIGFGYGGGASSADTDTQAVYRLDRWTGKVEYCLAGNINPDGELEIMCPASPKKAYEEKLKQ